MNPGNSTGVPSIRTGDFVPPTERLPTRSSSLALLDDRVTLWRCSFSYKLFGWQDALLDVNVTLWLLRDESVKSRKQNFQQVMLLIQWTTAVPYNWKPTFWPVLWGTEVRLSFTGLAQVTSFNLPRENVESRTFLFKFYFNDMDNC